MYNSRNKKKRGNAMDAAEQAAYDFMNRDYLVGKVIRLHSTTQPERYKLYMVTNEAYDGLANGHVRQETVEEWRKNGLKITVFDKLHTL